MDNKGSNAAWCFFGIVITFIFLALTDQSLGEEQYWNGVAAVGTWAAVVLTLFLSLTTFTREDKEKESRKENSKKVLLILCRPVVTEIQSILTGFLNHIQRDDQLSPPARDAADQRKFVEIERIIDSENNFEVRRGLMNRLMTIVVPHFNDLSKLSFSLAINQIHRIADIDNKSADELVLIMSELSFMQDQYQNLMLELQRNESVFTWESGITTKYLIGSSKGIIKTVDNFVARNY